MTSTSKGCGREDGLGERRIALVTGGGGGIGEAICRRLADDGCRVVVGDLNESAAGGVAADIGGSAVPLDVTDPAVSKSAIEQIASELGSVSILVNCAGWDESMPFRESDDAFAAKVLAINLAGPIRMSRLVLDGMEEAGWGRIINIASDAGRVGASLEAIYSGAKGGLIAFTKAIAREEARFGITANAVCPGPTETPLLDAVRATKGGDRVIEATRRAIPLRRLAVPDDIAPAVAFLASNEAGYITGQTLSVSGGLTMA